MNTEGLAESLRASINNGSTLVQWHLDYLEKMVAIDSRSFNVNEFAGDRKTPTDMQEILQLTREYLEAIGFVNIKINRPPPGPERSTPIIMAELIAGKDKPTLLMYAHLDKQPYMDDEKFRKWAGVAPTQLRWNADRTRAYGRGAADDLSGVIAIGMSVHAMLEHIGFSPGDPGKNALAKMPCNIKALFETEEESGSHTLIKQIEQNQEFFADCDCVIITDVVNPAQGVPGLTTSLRGIAQADVVMREKAGPHKIDAQTALYKTLASLCHANRSLAIEEIANADAPVTPEEMAKLALIPITVAELRETAGLLPATRLTVPDDKVEVIKAQLRKSYANVRPGHRVAGGVIFGAAGACLTFRVQAGADRSKLKNLLRETLAGWNTYDLDLELTEAEPSGAGQASFNLTLTSAHNDPHSGVHGGPFPIPEIELARMIDQLIGDDGEINVRGIGQFLADGKNGPMTKVRGLHAEHDGSTRPFADPTAKAQVEIRLAPGNDENKVGERLKEHLTKNAPAGFTLEIKEDKAGPPWITGIDHPVFPVILEALESGYGQKACLYGCGGSIPFVGKLTKALGGIPPLCLAPYDPACKMHEPGESLSMPDLLGCARSIAIFIATAPKAFPNPHIRDDG